jgi:hypothetical protein
VAAAITSTATPSQLEFISSDSPNLLLFSPLTAPAGSTDCVHPSATYTGTYTAQGYLYLPSTSGFTITREGTGTGCFTPPATGTTGYFTLYLEHLVNGSWQYVDQVWTFDSEPLQLSAWMTPGSYRWKVFVVPSRSGVPLGYTLRGSYP